MQCTTCLAVFGCPDKQHLLSPQLCARHLPSTMHVSPHLFGNTLKEKGAKQEQLLHLLNSAVVAESSHTDSKYRVGIAVFQSS